MASPVVSENPTVGGYSFYLNVVVIGSNAQDGDPGATPDRKIPSRSTSSEQDPAESEPILEEEPTAAPSSSSETENGGGAVVVSANKPPPIDPKMKLLMEGRTLYNAFTKRTPKAKADNGQGMLSSIGKSISKRSTQLREGASRMVANKTMVSRAEKAVGECIPLVTEEIGVEMSISKRFQQGPVFVLEVDMKGCDLLELLDKVLGEESARHYRNIKEGLENLDLPIAKEAFIKEILPKVRKGMMDKMSEIVPEKMKLKKNYADLEIQCVALEVS